VISAEALVVQLVLSEDLLKVTAERDSSDTNWHSGAA
jgi:hypothetical protein